MKRIRYKDRKRRGKSRLVPFIPSEGAKHRHARRKAIAEHFEKECIAQATALGFDIAIRNEGHHWQFRYGQLCVDWWPSTAKMVIDQQWQDGIHVYDYKQVIRELRRILIEIGAIPQKEPK